MLQTRIPQFEATPRFSCEIAPRASESKTATYTLLQAQANSLPLADESVQCVVTSPPYWGLRKYAGEQELVWGDGWRGAYGLEPTIELYVGHTVEILREIRRVLRKDGVCFWNVGDSYSGGAENNCKPKDLCLIPARVALAAQADGWWVRSIIIWAKPNPMPESVKDRPTDAYEHILMLTKSAKYFWDKDAVSEPKAASTVRDSRHNEDGKRRDRGYVGAPSMGGTNLGGPGGNRNVRNVWTFPTQPYKGAHFATFPEELPRRCIKAASKPGDVILDPFCGSGTTGKVALELGRQFIGVDLAYHDLAKRRIESVQDVAVRADLSLCNPN